MPSFFSKRGQRGQAAVETAIILPMMTFMVLGIIQLTMMQQAALMTDYAAYQACRAGIVWNGNNDKMVDAARVALAPTIGKSKLYPLASGIRDGTAGLVDLAKNIGSLVAADAVASVAGMKIVRVDVVRPNRAAFNAVASRTPIPGNNKELFFDDVGITGNGAYGFAANENYRQALQLTIRLRYLYELRIPFADWIIQTCFFAANAPQVMALGGQFGQESVGTGKTIVEGSSEEATAAAEAGAASALSNPARTNTPASQATLTKPDFVKLWAARSAGIYLVPLSSTYTMRMQSNLYYKNLTNP